MATRFRTDCEGFHRRDFIQLGAAGLLGLSLPQALRSEARAAKRDDDVSIFTRGLPIGFDELFSRVFRIRCVG